MPIKSVKKIDLCDKCLKEKPEYLVRYESEGMFKKTDILLLCKKCLDSAKAKQDIAKGEWV